MNLYYSDESINQHVQNTVNRGTLSNKCSFLFAIVTVVLLSNGCTVFGLRKDLSILDQTAEVSGKVAATHNSESPIFVALYQEKEDNEQKDRVAGCGLQVARCGLWVAGCELCVTGCALRVASCVLRIAGCCVFRSIAG